MKYTIKRREAPAEISYSQNSEGEGTVELIWSTGYKGLRQEFDSSFYEELEMTPEACDLSRLNAGAPFLNQHTQEVSQTLGVVESARIENGIGKATVRFSQRPELQGIIADVKSGILRNISVGYKVFQFTDVTGLGESVRTLRATKWQPMEISLVSIGFDPFAQILRADSEPNEVEIIEQNKETRMTQEELNLLEELLAKKAKEEAEVKAEPTAEEPPVEQQQEEPKQETSPAEEPIEEEKQKEEEKRKAQEATAEDERCESIRIAVRAAGFNSDYAFELIEKQLSPEQATKEIFNKLQNKTETKEQRQMTKQQLLEQAILNRINARKFTCDASNPYKGATLMDIAKEVVEKRAGETDVKFAERAMGSADLANILANVSNKVLTEDSGVEYSYKKIAEEVQLRDFKATPIVRLSATGLSNKSSETGDYTDTSMTDSKETIQLKDRGALFKISYVALMNDDLGALAKFPQKAEQMGGRDIETQLYAVLNANGNMNDGKALFHTDHNNTIAAGTAPSVAQLDAAQQKMSAFADDSGNPLDLTIKYLVVPPSQALAAQQVAAEIMASSSTNVNPFGGRIEVIISSRLAQVGGKDAWYCVADPAEYAALVYGTMQGQGDKPEVSVEEDFNSKNMKIRVTQPSAAAAASYKGIVRIVLA